MMDLAFFHFINPLTTYKDLFVSILWPNEIAERIKRSPGNNTYDPELLQLLSKLKEDDNPILIFYKVKENNPLY